MNSQHSSKAGDEDTGGHLPHWKEIVRKYQRTCAWKSLWQLTNTLVPYVSLWVAMYYSLRVSYWLVIPLALLAGAFLIRTFIIFHDCTHGSFFKSELANQIVGFVTGALVFTPYHHWRWEHTVHHARAGDLDRRGMGDVWTMTVEEYLESPRWRRFAYRLLRNPFVLFVFAPLFLFIVIHRLPVKGVGLRARRWLHAENLAILLVAIGLSSIFGIKAYLVIQLTVLAVASIAGVWLFYVQHQFEDAYWERRPDWDYSRAALEGSSFYKLPKILQWFSGNIGFHHIHHLSPRIPNYELERAHRSEPMFQKVKPLTVRRSLTSLSLRLWDESSGRLTGYHSLKGRRRGRSNNQ
jgi:omega-6 fatty acid desaturase (delta-12 desaturase)